MIEWIKFVYSLGKKENSVEFMALCSAIRESAKISEDPDGYNDPVGKTKYFKFPKSGIEIGFRHNQLSHVHFYFESEDGYSPFLSLLQSGIGSGVSEHDVIQKLGSPTLRGGGKMDLLLGYINKWIKYDLEGFSINFQFNKHEVLCRATLMK